MLASPQITTQTESLTVIPLLFPIFFSSSKDMYYAYWDYLYPLGVLKANHCWFRNHIFKYAGVTLRIS